MVLILLGQGAQIRHLADARSAEGGPDVDHGQGVTLEHGLVQLIALQVLGGELGQDAKGGFVVLRGFLGLVGLLRIGLGGLAGAGGGAALIRAGRGRLAAAAGEPQTKAEGEKEKDRFLHNRLLKI